MTALRLLWLALAVPAAGLMLLDLLGCRPATRMAMLGQAIAVGAAAWLLALALPLAWDGRLHTGPGLLLLALGTLTRLPSLLRVCVSRPRPVHVLLLLGLGLLVQAVDQAPMRGYDAKAIYGLKAKALAHEGHLFGAVFQDPEVVHYHADYPPGVPLLMAACARLSGASSDDPAGLAPAGDAQTWSARHDGVERYVPLAALWVVALLALVGAAVRRQITTDLPWLLLLLTALPVTMLMPFAAGRAWTWAGADLPLLALLTAVAVVARELFRMASRGRCALLVLLTAATLLVKQDAWLALVALGTSTALVGPERGRRRVLVSLVLGALLGAAITARVRGFGLAAPYDEHWFAALLAATPASVAARLPTLLGQIPGVLAERGLLLHFALLGALVLPLGLMRRGVPRWLALAIALHMLGSTALFLITPAVLPWHLSTALPRLWAHAAGPAALLAAEVLGALWARPEASRRRRALGCSSAPKPGASKRHGLRLLAPQLPPPR